MRWLLLLVLLLITWLGARGLDADALWYDEWFSVYRAGGAQYGPLAIGEVWDRVVRDIFETPAHYLMLSEWGKLVGWTEFAARSLSLFLGLLAVSWLYRLGCELLSPVVGLSAAVIFGLSAFYINYLHEMRTYTLLALLVIIVVWAYWRVVHTSANFTIRIILVLSTAGLVYAHYMGALVPAALAFYHLIFVRKDRRWWLVVSLFALALVLFVIPWYGEIVHTITYARTNENRQMLGLPTNELLEQAAYLYGNASVAFLVLLIVVALGRLQRNERFVWLIALGTLGLSLLVNTLLPVLNHPRYLMPVWPLLALVAGLGIQRLHQKHISAGILLGIWIAAGIWQTSSADFASDVQGGAFTDLPWHTLVDTLEGRIAEEDVVAYHRPDDVWAIQRIFDYYLYGLPGRHTIMELLPGREINDEFLQQARHFIDHAPRVWLAVDKTRAPNFRLADFQQALADDYAACGTLFDLTRMRLDLYARKLDPTDTTAVFGEGIRLYAVEPLPENAGQTLNLTLGWEVAPDIPPYTYSVALHVDNAAGQLMAQADFGLPETGYTCLPIQIDLQTLPPGEYRLLAIVYAYESGLRLTGQTGNQVDERLLLSMFTH